MCEKPKSFRSLQIPVPPVPILERALGIPACCPVRFVAIWWDPASYQVMVDDGLAVSLGDWTGYLSFIYHRSVIPYLIGFNIGDPLAAGSSYEEVTLRLVIDLTDREAYLAPAGDAGDFLRAQWPEMEDRGLDEVLARFRVRIQARIQEFRRARSRPDEGQAMLAQDQAAGELTAWLDRWALTRQAESC